MGDVVRSSQQRPVTAHADDQRNTLGLEMPPRAMDDPGLRPESFERGLHAFERRDMIVMRFAPTLDAGISLSQQSRNPGITPLIQEALVGRAFGDDDYLRLSHTSCEQ